jgi:CheY-like chemotaxis protein
MVSRAAMLRRIDQLETPQPLDIVLAEDDADQAHLNQLVLEAEGHHVEVATDGAEALEAVRRTEPDLLILDMQMPEGGGLEVLEELRSEPATADQPVIVMSNKDLTEVEERRLARLGVLDFLAKWKVHPKLLVGWLRGWAASRVRRFSPRPRRA